MPPVTPYSQTGYAEVSRWVCKFMFAHHLSLPRWYDWNHLLAFFHQDPLLENNESFSQTGNTKRLRSRDEISWYAFAMGTGGADGNSSSSNAANERHDFAAVNRAGSSEEAERQREMPSVLA